MLGGSLIEDLIQLIGGRGGSLEVAILQLKQIPKERVERRY